MFTKIQKGDKVFVDGQECEVTRVSVARFWVKIGETEVKFIKSSGKEYGAQSTRVATVEPQPAETAQDAPAEETVEEEVKPAEQ